MDFSTKNIQTEIKDIDSVSRRVIVMLSRFDNVDYHGEVIVKGAFTKSISERGPESGCNRKIQFLRYHDFEHQIGKFTKLEETNDGLVAYATLGRGTKGNDALLDYEDGIITQHSIGYQKVAGKIEFQDDVKILRELSLWEGSAVTFGMNSETGVLSVGKSIDAQYVSRLSKKMDAIINGLKNGKGTDERLFSMEMNLRVLQAEYDRVIKALRGSEPAKPLAGPNQPSNLFDQTMYNLI